MEKTKSLFVLLVTQILLFALAGSGSADTNVSGMISSDATWTLAESPYIVTGSVLVNSDVILTIEPGVTVKFDSLKALQIDGTLIAKGTNSNKITFTSHQPSPSAGDWGYILFSDLSTDATYDINGNYTGGSILEYAVIEYAGGASVDDNGAVRMDNAHPYINHCTIRSNSASGICGRNLSSDLRIYNNLITNNASLSTGGGINVSGGTISISANTISKNSAQCAYIGSYNASGAGIFIGYGDDVHILNNIITDNIPNGGVGGGINVNDGSVNIIDNIIRNNIGEGIHIRYGTVIISNNIITMNEQGISCSLTWSSVVITNNVVSDNAAQIPPWVPGGGIALYGNNNKSITHNAILRNSTQNWAGGETASGVYFGLANNDLFQNNTIAYNVATGAVPTCTISFGNFQYLTFFPTFPVFNYNNVFGNMATYELCNNNAQGSDNVNAINNWWGSIIDSQIQGRIYDWFDDSARGIVDYSPFATAILVDPPVSPPTGLTVIAGTGQITVDWTTNPEADIAGYKVYWSTTSGFPYADVADVGNVTSYAITGLAPDTYHVTVTAYDTSYNPGNDNPDTIVNENQTNGNESWFATEAAVPVCDVSFADLPSGFWAENYVRALYCEGITTGCTQIPLNYCPSNNVTRQAMAAFIIRALYGENFTYPTTPYFTDVPDIHQFFKYIQKMRELNITTGCTATEYCPGNNVTRQAMAAFIIRAKFGETFDYTATTYFTDVPNTNQFLKYVQKMKDEGITTGCTATEYCPTDNVNRAAMAAFLARGFLGMP